MIPIDSKSYPYLAVAQVLKLDYEKVLGWPIEEIKAQQEIYSIAKPVKEMTQAQLENYSKHTTSVHCREIWNAAIEKATIVSRENGEGCCHEIWDEIRKLKI